MYKKTKIFLLILVVALGSFSFTDSYFEIAKNLDIFTTVYRELNNFYVDETDPGKLMKTAIDEMLKSLDPYTNYIPESEIEDFKFMTTGQYGGIGAVITKRDNFVYISEPYEGFPAQKSGLMAGDKILKIDGVDAKGKTTEEVSKVLKGQPNTEVQLLIERPYTNESFEVSFKRQKISVKSVPYFAYIEEGIGYLKLRSFTRNCSKDVKNAIVDLQSDGDLNGLILDLRNNPGGLLNESVDIVNLFVKKGQEVVSTRGKIDSWDKVYNANKEPLNLDVPLVVLINQSSASASEIVSGAVQDLDRGVVIGQRSYGKGLVQQTRKLSYNSQLKLTVAKYYIPSGRCIQALDYSNRNKDGSVGKISDSLMTAFKTKNGRIVFDGGGIKPDVEVEDEGVSNLIFSLVRERLIFDYATLYRHQNESLLFDSTACISEEGFGLFTEFLSDKSYDYKTETEKAFENLKKKSEKESYYDLIKEEYDLLFSEFELNKKNDLNRNKETIKEILSGEIVSRYSFQEGRIKSSLNFDPDVKKALEILSDPSLYKEILTK
jgi:carboxyl-terminal processing protease|tara:strand:- start:13608 stop:15248 length:1641 start_codon:yes stop_codon:yes gene_type:complete